MPPRADRLGLIAALAAGWLTACHSPAAELLEAGHQALGQGRYREALARYEEAVLEAPGSPEAAQALYDIALIHYLKQRDLDSARASLRKLLSDYPRSRVAREARRMLARMYAEDLDAPDKAIEEYAKLLEGSSDPDEEKSLRLSIANCYYALNELELAASDYRKVIEEFPHDARSDQAYLNLAHIERLVGGPAKAFGVLQALMGRSSAPEWRRRAYLAMADTLVELARYDEAGSCLARAAREFPEDPELRAHAARLAERQGGIAAPASGEGRPEELKQDPEAKIRWGRARH